VRLVPVTQSFGREGRCRMRTVLCLGLAGYLAAAGSAAPVGKDPPPKGPPIVGEWEFVSLTVNGRTDLGDPFVWAFAADGTMVIRKYDKVLSGPRRGYALGADGDPAALDVIADTADAGTPVYRGLWKVDGDTLTICTGNDGPRPAAFDSPKGSQAFLYVFRRVTAKNPAAKRGDPSPLGGGGTGRLLAEWSGGSADPKDGDLWKKRPARGYIADPKEWEALWEAWGAGQPRPAVDFATELLVVGADAGPRVGLSRPMQSAAGDLQFSQVVGGPAGPGFAYKILKVSRADVKSVNGKALPPE
jgi:uncharacterized protein (TIGR03067 family)